MENDDVISCRPAEKITVALEQITIALEKCV